MDVIRFENLHLTYGQGWVLERVNLRIQPGEHWVILGANGSGKTSLIRTMSSDLYPSEKHEYVQEIFGQARWNIFELKSHLGIVTRDLCTQFERNSPFLTAYQVVLSGFHSARRIYSHQNYSDDQRKKVESIMELLEISEIRDQTVNQMSTGQLLRCVIGRALVHEPKAFVLDEPTSGLDIKAQASFIKLLRKLSADITMILVTHHVEEVFDEITHVALVADNRIFRQGDKASVMTSENLSKTFGADVELGVESGRYFIQSVK